MPKRFIFSSVITLILLILWGTLQPNEILDVNIHDTYYVIFFEDISFLMVFYLLLTQLLSTIILYFLKRRLTPLGIRLAYISLITPILLALSISISGLVLSSVGLLSPVHFIYPIVQLFLFITFLLVPVTLLIQITLSKTK
jgi:hypothetical protein